LRKHVLEYIKYTERKALTQPFNPTDDEQALYERISAFLQKEDSYALPKTAAPSDRPDPAQAAGLQLACRRRHA
jgi:hypothetical protein